MISVVGKKLFFSGYVSLKNVSRTVVLLAKNPSITSIELSTRGGHIEPGFQLVSFIKTNRPDITINVVGYAYSMGTVILAAGNHKTMGPNDLLMYHEISQDISGDHKTSDFSDQFKIHSIMNETMKNIINPTGRSNINFFLTEVLNGRRDYYLTAKEALAIGLIDEIR